MRFRTDATGYLLEIVEGDDGAPCGEPMYLALRHDDSERYHCSEVQLRFPIDPTHYVRRRRSE